MTHLSVAISEMADGKANRESVDREIRRTLAIVDSLPDDRSIPLPYATAGNWYLTRGDLAPGGMGGFWYQQALTALERARRIDRALHEELVRLNRPRGMSYPLDSPSPNLYLDLGRVYLRLAQPRLAIEAFEYGRLIAPRPDYSHELANAYQAEGDGERAAIALHEGLMLDPGDRPLATRLVSLYRKIDPDGCAVETAGNRASLNFQCPLVRNVSCKAARNVVDLFTKTGGRAADAEQLRAAAVQNWGCPASLSL